MLYFLKLIRFPNLLLMALSMYLVKYCLFVQYIIEGQAVNNTIQISRNLSWISFTLNSMDFFLLVFSTLLVAAAGYIINDYMDIEIDTVNKPEKMIIGKHITSRQAEILYLVLNVTAILIGFYAALKIGHWKFSFIHPLSVLLLWLYSSRLKKMYLVGNTVIAFLSALILMLPALFEPKVYDMAQSTLGFVTGYSVFAFLVSLVREIIKDAEDKKGDELYGCRTLPVVSGIKASKAVVIILVLFIVSLLGYIQYMQLITNDYISFWYFMLAIQLPLLSLAYIIFEAKEKKNFSRAGLLAKGIMLTGILSMTVFLYSLA